jgi:hypothetical protein
MKANLLHQFIFAAGLSFAALNLSSCAGTGAMKSEFTEENKAIPPDFGKNKSEVLLCVLQRGSYNGYLKSAAKENYNGQYVFIQSSELNSATYADKTKYRYFFDYDGGSSVSYSNGGSSTFKRFFVKDRLENKKYQSGAEFSFYAKAMKIYMANLETKRKSMQ